MTSRRLSARDLRLREMARDNAGRPLRGVVGWGGVNRAVVARRADRRLERSYLRSLSGAERRRVEAVKRGQRALVWLTERAGHYRRSQLGKLRPGERR